MCVLCKWDESSSLQDPDEIRKRMVNLLVLGLRLEKKGLCREDRRRHAAKRLYAAYSFMLTLLESETKGIDFLKKYQEKRIRKMQRDFLEANCVLD